MGCSQGVSIPLRKFPRNENSGALRRPVCGFHSTKEVSKAEVLDQEGEEEDEVSIPLRKFPRLYGMSTITPDETGFHSTKEVSKERPKAGESLACPVSIPLRKFPRPLAIPVVHLLLLFPFH